MKTLTLILSFLFLLNAHAQPGKAKTLDEEMADSFSRMRKMMQAQGQMMNQMMNSLVTDKDFDNFGSALGGGPKVVRKDEKKSINYELHLEGVDKDSLNIVVENGLVRISGETKVEQIDESQNSKSRRVSISSFSKAFPVPQGAEESSFSVEEKDKSILLLKFNRTKI
ncbi:MAG: Hsp20/alpha crystallin family protein [Bacteriovoracaceae bacterium]|nr:Hsp20/alpha crystallin family protein [Bacteriovoracaceae bacterium]